MIKQLKLTRRFIGRNNKLQLAYYNRGFAYFATKKYNKALDDFNKVMSLHTFGNSKIIFTLNQDSPFADEEAKTQVPYDDALYECALTKYSMDSLKSSFIDFQTLIDREYHEKSQLYSLAGKICARAGKLDKACDYFAKAKQVALSEDDNKDADEMIKTYCDKKTNNR